VARGRDMPFQMPGPGPARLVGNTSGGQGDCVAPRDLASETDANVLVGGQHPE
jgi:hypothetical protein